MEKEKFYFVFKFIDGNEKEFEKDDDKLSALIRNTDKERIMVDNMIITLKNVISVTIETKSERENAQKEYEKQQIESAEALSSINF